MSNIKENYVSYEVARLLEKKGFNETCYACYEYFESGVTLYRGWMFEYKGNPVHNSSERIKCPTLQMAMKWLREVHNIDIDINACCGMLGIRCYSAYVSTYKPYKLTDIDKKFGLTEDDVKHRLVQSKRNTRIPSKSEIIPAHEYFDTYEKAVEAAIKYCLNLIK